MYRPALLVALALPLLWVTASCGFDGSVDSLNSLNDASSTTDGAGRSTVDASGSTTSDAPAPASPPVGQWTFNAGQELIDTQGNFPDLVLQGNANVSGGMLDVNGSGTDASGWAVTGDSNNLYSGPLIVDKTLVSWVTLEQLQSGGGVALGSAITLDRESSDHFDGLIFGEREEDRWMSGSSSFSRTDDFVPGFQETTSGTEVMLAVTYDDADDTPGGAMEITGYRNGVAIGSYSSDAGSSWTTNDAEIIFGKRHGSKSDGPGAIDALINEARVYDIVLSAAEIQALVPVIAN